MKNISELELQIIAQEVNDIIQLILSNGTEEFINVVALNLPPCFALVAEGSKEYINSHLKNELFGPFKTPLFDTYPQNITRLRTLEKLFDDNQGGMSTLIKSSELAYTKSGEMFRSLHEGLLGRFRRNLQPDLGVYYLGGHVISSTQIALLTVGFTNKQISAMTFSDLTKNPFILEFCESIGGYFRLLYNVFKEMGVSTKETIVPQMIGKPIQITYNDYFGQKVYSQLSDRLGLIRPGFVPVILFIIAQVNFVEKLLPRLLPSNSTLLLRQSFLLAYHSTRAFKHLTQTRGYIPESRLEKIITRILNDPDSDLLIKSSKARNIMAHYGFLESSKFILNSEDPFDQILNGLFKMGHHETLEFVQRQLHMISELFVEEISKTSL